MGKCSPIGENDRRLNQLAKIRLLDSITDDIISFGATQGLTAMKTFLDENYGVIPEGEFSQVVDVMAPHQALSALMAIAEIRFASAITIIGEKYLEEIKKICYEKGKDLNVKAETPEDAFNLYALYVLDGMPCDDTKEIQEQSEKKLVWKKMMDTHEESWKAARGNISIYYTLLKCFIDGLLSSSPIDFTIDANSIFTFTAR